MTGSITRREFVARGAAAALALAARGCAADADSQEPAARPTTRVLVAGAGLAGLVAAYELAKRGVDVTVLEARDRAGGRVHTLRGFGDGLHVEAGAVYVPEGHYHTVRYARELGVELIPAPRARTGTGERYFVGGRSVRIAGGAPPRWPVRLSPGEARLSPDALRARYLEPAVDEIGDPEHPAWPGEAALRYDRMSLGDLLRSRGAPQGAVSLMRLGYLDEWGDGIDRCSALAIMRDMALLRSAGQMHLVRGGTDRLAYAFAARLGARIRYGCAVTAIEHDANGVRVTARSRAGAAVVSADRLVCAIPFPVLRGVRVSPPFSAAKRRAIGTARTTSITRVYLQLRERCWDEAEVAVPTDLPVMHLLDATAGQPGRRAVLEAFVTGPNARHAAAMGPDARVAWALEQAERVHPGVRGRFERGSSYGWDADPWARGDYAWFAPGELGAAGPHLGTVEGRVHFAGDHTSARPGWMQGALASGLRVVDEIHGTSST